MVRKRNISDLVVHTVDSIITLGIVKQNRIILGYPEKENTIANLKSREYMVIGMIKSPE